RCSYVAVLLLALSTSHSVASLPFSTHDYSRPDKLVSAPAGSIRLQWSCGDVGGGSPRAKQTESGAGSGCTCIRIKIEEERARAITRTGAVAFFPIHRLAFLFDRRKLLAGHTPAQTSVPV